MTSELISTVYVLFKRLTGFEFLDKTKPPIARGLELSQPVIGRIAPPRRIGETH
jgi:hypothetical protein